MPWNSRDYNFRPFLTLKGRKFVILGPSVRLSGVVLIEDLVEGVPERCHCSFLSGHVVSGGGDLVPICQRANPRKFNLHALISHALNTWISCMPIQKLLPKKMSMEMISPSCESNSISPKRRTPGSETYSKLFRTRFHRRCRTGYHPTRSCDSKATCSEMGVRVRRLKNAE